MHRRGNRDVETFTRLRDELTVLVERWVEQGVEPADAVLALVTTGIANLAIIDHVRDVPEPEAVGMLVNTYTQARRAAEAMGAGEEAPKTQTIADVERAAGVTVITRKRETVH